MSTAVVMLVKDEFDIIAHNLWHLLDQVDQVYVSDNVSTDGTAEMLDELASVTPELVVSRDPVVGYWQSSKTTKLALAALEAGHRWVIPVDADEYWYAPDGRTLGAFLDGVVPDVQVIKAVLFNHLPTPDDPAEDSPFARIGWRQREHQELGKVACRLRHDLVILPGNHDATTSGTGTRGGGLVIRHYSWRSAEQYVKKIRNGQEAYARTNLPEDLGGHWRMWEGRTDEDIAAHFYEFFQSEHPEQDETLIYDPIVTPTTVSRIVPSDEA